MCSSIIQDSHMVDHYVRVFNLLENILEKYGAAFTITFNEIFGWRGEESQVFPTPCMKPCTRTCIPFVGGIDFDFVFLVNTFHASSLCVYACHLLSFLVCSFLCSPSLSPRSPAPSARLLAPESHEGVPSASTASIGEAHEGRGRFLRRRFRG